MSDYSTTPVKRSRPTRSDLLREPREELVERCLLLQGVIEQLSTKQPSDDLVQLKEMNEKLRAESSQREGILVMRLTGKEQEVQDLLAQLHDTKQSLCPGSSQLQKVLLDPAVNLLFESFKKELEDSKAQLKQAQDDLAAYKFTPDSHIGKRLMAKCRLLLNENEELGRTISSGSVAKLESTIALEKKLSQEMRKAEKDTEYVLHELSDDMEAMQSTIYHLQQTLKETIEQLHLAQEENRRLRTTLPPSGGTPVSLTETPGAGGASEGATPPQVKQRTNSNSEDLHRLKRTAPPSPVTPNAPRLKSRHTDKADASAERTNCKSGSGARNRGTGSHGNQDRAKGSGGRVERHVRQGGDPPSESRTSSGTGGSVAVTTRQDEPSNGSSRHSSVAESVAMDTSDAADNSRSTNERENQRQRAGNKMDANSPSELVANGLVVGKHSTLTDATAACQKV